MSTLYELWLLFSLCVLGIGMIVTLLFVRSWMDRTESWCKRNSEEILKIYDYVRREKESEIETLATHEARLEIAQQRKH